MKNNKLLLILSIVTLLMVCAIAQAAPTINTVKIDGDTQTPGTSLVVERGDKLDISVKVVSNQSEKNVVVEAYLDGYEYSSREPVSDSSEVFDMDTNDAKTSRLSITIPLKAERDHYDLKIRAGGRTGADSFVTYNLNLKGKKHEMIVKDILMNDEIVAGRGLFTNVKVQNVGQVDEKDVTVRVTIPELNIEEFTTIQSVDADDSTTSEDVVLFIDECTKPGDYDVTASIEYNEFDKISKTKTLTVKPTDGVCQKTAVGQSKTLVSLPGKQDTVAGQTAIFPIMITNTGASPQTYVISVSRAVEAFGVAKIDPSNVLILQPNKAETVFVYVKTNDNAPSGQKDFAVSIMSGTEKQDLPLSLNVTAGSSNVFGGNALVLFLVALIFVFVIIGVIMGFNKLKPKHDEDEGSEELGTKTYY